MVNFGEITGRDTCPWEGLSNRSSLFVVRSSLWIWLAAPANQI